MYLIVNDETGKYCARFGEVNSYTRNLTAAQVFHSREEAERHCCSNERVISLVEEMGISND